MTTEMHDGEEKKRSNTTSTDCLFVNEVNHRKIFIFGWSNENESFMDCVISSIESKYNNGCMLFSNQNLTKFWATNSRLSFRWDETDNLYWQNEKKNVSKWVVAIRQTIRADVNRYRFISHENWHKWRKQRGTGCVSGTAYGIYQM